MSADRPGTAEELATLQVAVLELLERVAELEWRVLPYEAHPPFDDRKGKPAR